MCIGYKEDQGKEKQKLLNRTANNRKKKKPNVIPPNPQRCPFFECV